ncbi:Serine/threonine-protein phosphatase 7 long form like [Apostasia shenzhenica]|uniref:Serine/threonine-protein phosphatase 7 long form like n=1 Tax=Apostasia shenzhenica TaxID=1088818 RepID=A0A2I0AIX0_9ASPA|nr:Serine/threonine-protein phosphatase 7 long form like [Apostasia shenzhenica]
MATAGNLMKKTSAPSASRIRMETPPLIAVSKLDFSIRDDGLEEPVVAEEDGRDGRSWPTKRQKVDGHTKVVRPSDPLPRLKPSMAPHLKMGTTIPRGQSRCQNINFEDVEVNEVESPATPHYELANVRGEHKAALIHKISVKDSCSDLAMVRDWLVECPIFIDALKIAGVEQLRHFRWTPIDRRLISALIERWCPETNTFHLPVGEMTITLQDVAIILGIRIDGHPLIGEPRVGGRSDQWLTWPQCCDELLGEHPDKEVEIENPFNPGETARFDMGQAKSKTCVPLRWLKWRFCHRSYADLQKGKLEHCVRAYILFQIGSFLMPDTSFCEVHLQWLPELENLERFKEYSLGGAVLAHLYRELREAVLCKRKHMSGCLHLLQFWAWEHFCIGRPKLDMPDLPKGGNFPLGYRWNQGLVRKELRSSLKCYRSEFNSLQQSQVIWTPYTQNVLQQLPAICTHGKDIWVARVPLIAWVRVEWHLPDRVMRQFGYQQHISLAAVDEVERVSARGKGNENWFSYHAKYRQLWDARREMLQLPVHVDDDDDKALVRYMHWYLQWAKLDVGRPPVSLPKTYYPQGPVERELCEFLHQTKQTLESLGVNAEHDALLRARDRIMDMAGKVTLKLHLVDYSEVIRGNVSAGDSVPGFPKEIGDKVELLGDF